MKKKYIQVHSWEFLQLAQLGKNLVCAWIKVQNHILYLIQKIYKNVESSFASWHVYVQNIKFFNVAFHKFYG